MLLGLGGANENTKIVASDDEGTSGLQAALYFLYFNTFPIFPYIVFKCPIIPIFLTSLKEKKVFCRLFLHWWMEQRQSFSWPK